MAAPKDDQTVIKFLTLFGKLRSMIDDDPVGLENLAANDESLERLCIELDWTATFLSINERRRPQLFAAPVDPNFIEAWRDYEVRYASPLAGISLMDFGLDLSGPPNAKESAFDARWENADHDAQALAGTIDSALKFSQEQISQDWRDFPEGFAESIEDGISAWERLVTETGFDLRDIFRRRELVPFVFIPRHVSSHHGQAERLSLLTHLQQAHDAFVFGVPFAAIALMRSILEVVLSKHYGSSGANLNEQINNCRNLPHGAHKQALHRLRKLANDVLHFNNERARLPADIEREVLSLLYVLRALIEGAPARRTP